MCDNLSLMRSRDVAVSLEDYVNSSSCCVLIEVKKPLKS